MNPIKAVSMVSLLSAMVACSNSSPTVNFTKATQTVKENVGTVTITAQLSYAYGDDDMVIPFTVTGSAKNPDDYTVTKSPIIIKAGKLSAPITINIDSNAVTGINKTIIVTMGTPENAHRGTIATNTTTITDSSVSAPTVPKSQFITDAGDIYIADTYNCVVRKVTKSTGIITTVAGMGTSCGNSGDGGPATSATLNYPTALAIDAQENIYIADTNNCEIRKVTKSTGIITTIAGTGTCGSATGDGGAATAAQFDNILGLYLDQSTGNLVIGDTFNNIVRVVIATDGTVHTLAGTGTQANAGDGGLATAADINYPGSFTTDSLGNLYFSELNSSDIRKINGTNGIISTITGTGSCSFSGDGGAATAAHICNAFGLTADENDNLLLGDTDNNVIRKIDATTGIISSIAGDQANPGYTGDGGLATVAEMNGPDAITIDTEGNIYFIDGYNHVLRRIDGVTGIISTTAGNGTYGFSGDGGAATSAQLGFPGPAGYWAD